MLLYKSPYKIGDRIGSVWHILSTWMQPPWRKASST